MTLAIADPPVISPPAGSSQPPDGAAPFRRLLTITAGAAPILALGEVGLVFPIIHETLGSTTGAAFFVLLVGNWLPYAALGAGGLVACGAVAAWAGLRARWRRGRVLVGSTRRSRRAQGKAPHIFVFSIDNLQVDHVGAYGYRKRLSTPHIDELATRGALFERAYSYQPQTRVFMTSMLLGRRIPDFGAHQPPAALQEFALTRMLKQRDYHILVKGIFELTRYRKFDPKVYWIDTNIERETPELIRKANKIPHVPYEERFRIVDRHLQQAGDKPVFVWLHLLGPHWFRGKFSPSDEFPFGSELTALYDSAIAGTDVWLGRLQKMVAERLRDERDVYWIVMSDHGAGLGAAQREKGKSVLESHVHVPLIFAGPGIRTARIDVPVDSALDSAATILDLAGVEIPDSYDGVSLLPLLRDGTGAEELAERVIPLRNGWLDGRRVQALEVRAIPQRRPALRSVPRSDGNRQPRRRAAGPHPLVVSPSGKEAARGQPAVQDRCQGLRR